MVYFMPFRYHGDFVELKRTCDEPIANYIMILVNTPKNKVVTKISFSGKTMHSNFFVVGSNNWNINLVLKSGFPSDLNECTAVLLLKAASLLDKDKILRMQENLDHDAISILKSYIADGLIYGNKVTPTSLTEMLFLFSNEFDKRFMLHPHSDVFGHIKIQYIRCHNNQPFKTDSYQPNPRIPGVENNCFVSSKDISSSTSTVDDVEADAALQELAAVASEARFRIYYLSRQRNLETYS